jgi:hypothetical protein
MHCECFPGFGHCRLVLGIVDDLDVKGIAVSRFPCPASGPGFSRHGGLSSDVFFVGVSTQRERIRSRAAKPRLDEPTQAIPRRGCIPALPASVSPGKLIVAPAVASPLRFSSEPASSFGLMRGAGSDTGSSGA